MRNFTYFLFDSFDPDDVKYPADDPRLVLNGDADAVLNAVMDAPMCTYDDLCNRFPKSYVDSLIHIGLLQVEDGRIRLDCPVLVQEDAAYLQHCFSAYIARMADSLEVHRDEFYSLAKKIDNGFSPEVNLYHLLCGAVFDGQFFDRLSDARVVTTSKLHPSGLDYLIVAYEKTPELDRLSQRLLCSYNRFSDGTRTLQSFGDAEGDRVDFYRFATQKHRGNIPQNLKDIEEIWDKLRNVRERILPETQRFVETGHCEDDCHRLLTAFGYIQNDKVAVPVYKQAHLPFMEQMEQLTAQCIFEDMQAALTAPEVFRPIFCVGRGAAVGEVANELYHIVFGQINELLVERHFVAAPQWYEGQGRYLKSIELMQAQLPEYAAAGGQ